MGNQALFTVPDAWKGGGFELYIASDDGTELCSWLKALWSHPKLQGCYKTSDSEPCTQVRVQPCEGDVAGLLFGVATLPNERLVPCLSHVTHYAGEQDCPPLYCVSFVVPMGALGTAYPVGAYPFGSVEHVPEWKPEVETWFSDVGRWIFARAPFHIALIGFEVSPQKSSLQEIERHGIPADRSDGILWNVEGKLEWYPATRP